ncbi:hypothetical protein [Synechococcus sp. MIT S1220]|uniref:hypothetical protein n=1 Tax=Synechococcus sp. MIT S1220 TaxID=3082549 RepID=UPI0039B02F70
MHLSLWVRIPPSPFLPRVQHRKINLVQGYRGFEPDHLHAIKVLYRLSCGCPGSAPL